MTARSLLRRALLLAGLVGLVAGIVWSRKELNEPTDRTGSAIPLPRVPRGTDRIADARLVARPGEPEWIVDLAGWVPKPISSRPLQLLAIVWALPSTVVGLLLGLLSSWPPPTCHLGAYAPLSPSGLRIVRGLLYRSKALPRRGAELSKGERDARRCRTWQRVAPGPAAAGCGGNGDAWGVWIGVCGTRRPRLTGNGRAFGGRRPARGRRSRGSAAAGPARRTWRTSRRSSWGRRGAASGR